MIQHRLRPRVFIASVVSPGLIAPASVLLHHSPTVRPNGLALLSGISATNSAGQEAMFHPPGSGPCTGGRPAGFAAQSSRQSVQSRASKVRPRSSRSSGRINLPMSSHSFRAVSVADKSVFTFPLLTCCPEFPELPVMRCHRVLLHGSPLLTGFNLRPDVIYVTGEFLLPLNLCEHFPSAIPVIPEGGKFSRCKFRFRQSRSHNAARRRKSSDGCQPSAIGNFPMGSSGHPEIQVPPPATAYRSVHWSEHSRARARYVWV